MARDLALDTAVTSVGDGRYTAEIGDDWSFRAPSGGVVATVGLRALVAELADPALRIRSMTTIFCTPVRPGPIALRVTTLRRGQVAAQLRAELYAGAETSAPAAEVIATFARDRDYFDFTDAVMPDLPSVEQSSPYAEHVPFRQGYSPPIFGNLEMRLARGSDWWQPEWQPGPARFARWMRYRVPQTLADGRFDPLAIVPFADTMPPSVVQKLGPDFPRFIAPSLDLTVHFLDDTRAEWLLVSSYTRRALGGIASAEVEIWSEDGRLVAFGTQVMMFRKPP